MNQTLIEDLGQDLVSKLQLVEFEKSVSMIEFTIQSLIYTSTKDIKPSKKPKADE